MTTTHTTQAAQHCADLANAVGVRWDAKHFQDDGQGACAAFRREVEAKDAMIREVLALLKPCEGRTSDDDALLANVRTLLRANLLPDPAPTLYEQWCNDHCGPPDSPQYAKGAAAALDWIAKRQEKEG